jgi:tetratricopeptide (TPR) repeat protein
LLATEKIPKNRKLIIVSLSLLALFVVFVLPNFISEPWVTNNSRQPLASVTTQQPVPSVIAEKTRYRQQSQAVLAEIIALRDSLQNQAVDQWANIQYNNSMSIIAVGDKQYSQGDYGPSLSSYEKALAELQQLQKLGNQKLQQALADAVLAIESALPSAKPTVYDATFLAMSIAPENPRSQELNKRSENFAELVNINQLAESLLQQQDYQGAKQQYQSALALDPKHQKIKTALQNVENTIKQKNFVNHMSRGYIALDKKNFDNALNEFQQAKRIYPNNIGVEQAISHVKTGKTQVIVEQQIAQAAHSEQQEKWHQASQLYQQLLETDPSLTQVRLKLTKTTMRADLDKALNSILNNPLSLADPKTYNQAKLLLNNSQQIVDPGNRLQHQIHHLDSLIQQARIAVDVHLESDNLTEINLFKVAKLGTFERMTVQLYPGHYVISGSRSGYRDVQIEITVNSTSSDSTIRIVCNQEI